LSTTDELLVANASYAATYERQQLTIYPRRKVVVVACMDARLDVFRLLGLELGDAHLLRNAGGVVTDDMIRSIMLSQRRQGTTEIVLIQHTDCALLKLDEEEFTRVVEQDTGVRPPFALEAFPSPEDGIRRSLGRIHSSPLLLHRDARGFVFDVDTGALREVE
jgi:carbonic anhydrase